MANAVVAVFDEYNEAQSTVNELLGAGFNQNEIKLSEEPSSEVKGSAARQPPRRSGVKGFFQNLFGMEEENDDIRLYDEAIRHGNYVVTAIARDEEKSEIASEVMSHHHPVDLDERSTEWLGAESTPREVTGAQSIPVVQEEVKIGKREVQRGGVRIFQKVSEVPIEEDLTLREERVVVERVPVDKPATAADLGAFREGSTELRERVEEPVISKTTRVVEEVRVGKEVSERKQTVRETARRTDVEVERTGSDDYREHWQQNYASQGGRYEDYQPAYEYGSIAAAQYQGRPWDEIEPDLRSDWETRNPNSKWERFKDSIKHAFGGRK